MTMERKKVLLIVVAAVFILLLAGAYVLYDHLSGKIASDQLASQTQQEDPQQNQDIAQNPKVKAPDFTVFDGEGKPVKLSDFFGKPIVLNFWASWCGPCKSEMPEFQKLYEEMGEDVLFMMVNATGGRETVASAKMFIAGTDYTFPVLFDTEGNAAVAYEVYSLPTTCFIDKDGYGIARAIGAIDEAILRKGIGMITG